MISYDFQAGTYNENYLKNRALYKEYHDQISKVLNQYIEKSYGADYTILEAGIGEGTTFGPVMRNLEFQPKCSYGFDISWSRIKACTRFLKQIEFDGNAFLFLGDLYAMPLRDQSIDLVYTVHALEPNGGNERKLLRELYRVAARYLILFEPSYEFANAKQRKRMEEHGYVKHLRQEAEALGYRIVEHKLLDVSLNPDNPTAVLVIEKKEPAASGDVLCDPVSKGTLILGQSSYFAADSLLAYPVVEGIPCLTPEHAVLATKYLDLM